MNQFEALCKLASKESWCWNLVCTTCGHMHFRRAFSELAEGKSPESPDWPIHARITKYSNQLGPLPRSYSKDQKERILNICREANISSIARDCKFPDWLGYLGLVLEHMYTRANIYQAVSTSWASQLDKLVPLNTRAHDRLCQIIDHQDELLGIKDLEICETDMKNILS